MKTQLKYGGLSANITQSRSKLLYLVLVSELPPSVRLGQPCALVMCHSVPLPCLSSLQSGSAHETCNPKPLDLLTVLSSTLLHLTHTFICPRSSAILYWPLGTQRGLAEDVDPTSYITASISVLSLSPQLRSSRKRMSGRGLPDTACFPS